MGPSVVLNTKKESFFIWKNLKIQRPPHHKKSLGERERWRGVRERKNEVKFLS